MRWYLNSLFYSELKGNDDVLNTGEQNAVDFQELVIQYDFYQGVSLSLIFMLVIAMSFKLLQFFSMKYINSSSR